MESLDPPQLLPELTQDSAANCNSNCDDKSDNYFDVVQVPVSSLGLSSNEVPSPFVQLLQEPISPPLNYTEENIVREQLFRYNIDVTEDLLDAISVVKNRSNYTLSDLITVLKHNNPHATLADSLELQCLKMTKSGELISNGYVNKLDNSYSDILKESDDVSKEKQLDNINFISMKDKPYQFPDVAAPNNCNRRDNNDKDRRVAISCSKCKRIGVRTNRLCCGHNCCNDCLRRHFSATIVLPEPIVDNCKASSEEPFSLNDFLNLPIEEAINHAVVTNINCPIYGCEKLLKLSELMGNCKQDSTNDYETSCPEESGSCRKKIKDKESHEGDKNQGNVNVNGNVNDDGNGNDDGSSDGNDSGAGDDIDMKEIKEVMSILLTLMKGKSKIMKNEMKFSINKKLDIVKRKLKLSGRTISSADNLDESIVEETEQSQIIESMKEFPSFGWTGEILNTISTVRSEYKYPIHAIFKVVVSLRCPPTVEEINSNLQTYCQSLKRMREQLCNNFMYDKADAKKVTIELPYRINKLLGAVIYLQTVAKNRNLDTMSATIESDNFISDGKLIMLYAECVEKQKLPRRYVLNAIAFEEATTVEEVHRRCVAYDNIPQKVNSDEFDNTSKKSTEQSTKKAETLTIEKVKSMKKEELWEHLRQRKLVESYQYLSLGPKNMRRMLLDSLDV